MQGSSEILTDYSQFTVLKPLEVRQSLNNATEIVDIQETNNFVNYTWNSPQESFTAIHGVALAVFLTFLAYSAYVLLREKMQKFTAFFITDQHYLRLKLNLKQSIIDNSINPSAQKSASKFKNKLSTDNFINSPQQQAQIVYNSPTKPNSQLDPEMLYHSDTQTAKQADISLMNRFLVNLSPIVNFYVPMLAIIQPLLKEQKHVGDHQNGAMTTFKTIKLPYVVVVAQFVIRLLLLTTTSVVISIILGSNCTFSRYKLNSSYFCLNEFDRNQGLSSLKIILGGLLTSVLVTPLCYKGSSVIFNNFVGYIKKFADPEKQEEQQQNIQKWREQRSASNHKSSVKKQKSSAKKQFIESAYDVSSFNLLVGDKGNKGMDDQSHSNVFALDESGYQSSNDRSVSTGLNYTDRGLLQSHFQSERSLVLTPKGLNGKFAQIQGDNNLLPIDEDDNDEKCSPIKPKRAQQYSSPTKNNDNEMSIGDGLGRPQMNQLNIFKQSSRESGYESLDIGLKIVKNHSSPEKLQANKPDLDNEPNIVSFDNSEQQSFELRQSRNLQIQQLNSCGGMSESNLTLEILMGLAPKNSNHQRQLSAQLNRFPHVESREGSTVGHGPAINSAERNDFSISNQDHTFTNVQAFDAQPATPPSKSATQKQKAKHILQIVLLLALILYIVFSVAMTAYVFANFAKNGLYLSLLTISAAYLCDMIVQVIMAIVMTTRQLISELKGNKLPLECLVLMQMSEERCQLVFDVYEKYEPTANVLVQLPIEINTEENDDIENGKIMMRNLRSPESLTNTLENKQSASKVNLKQVQVQKHQFLRKKVLFLAARGIEVEVEEIMDFVAPDSIPDQTNQKQESLECNIVSPHCPRDKKSAEMTNLFKRKKEIIPQNRFSLNTINLKAKKLRKNVSKDDILDSEFDDSEDRKVEDIPSDNIQIVNQSITPIKTNARNSAYKSNTKFSSYKKIQNYETPNEGQSLHKIPAAASYRITSVENSPVGERLENEQQLFGPQLSQVPQENLMSLKRLLDKDSEGNAASNSVSYTGGKETKQITPKLGFDASNRQSITKINANFDKAANKEEPKNSRNDKYSPMWSSVEQKKKIIPEDKSAVTKFDKERQEKQKSQRSQRKHNNFNSPRSLKKQMSMITSDRKGGTIESGKGTNRKLMMQDDANVSEQSLQYGSGCNKSLTSVEQKEGITTDKKLHSRKSARDMLNQILQEANSQVNFDEQGETNLQAIGNELNQIGEMENGIIKRRGPILVQHQQEQDCFNMKVQKVQNDLDDPHQTFAPDEKDQSIQKTTELNKQKTGNFQQKTPRLNDTLDIQRGKTGNFQRLILPTTEIQSKEINSKEKDKNKPKALIKQPNKLVTDQRSQSQTRPVIKPIGMVAANKHMKTDLIHESKLWKKPVSPKNERCSSVPLEDAQKAQKVKQEIDLEKKKVDLESTANLVQSIKTILEPNQRFNKAMPEITQIKEAPEGQEITPIQEVRRAHTVLQKDVPKYKPIQRKIQIHGIISPKAEPEGNQSQRGWNVQNNTALAVIRAGGFGDRRQSDQVVTLNKEGKQVSTGVRFRNSSLSQPNEIQAHNFQALLQRKASHPSAYAALGMPKQSLPNSNSNVQESGRNSSLTNPDDSKNRRAPLTQEEIARNAIQIRIQDQKRRLESFLMLARQAQAKRDIVRIKDMIKQIDETQKPLSMARINELKLLELMTSPYNQQLVSMISYEVGLIKKIKEQKKKDKEAAVLAQVQLEKPKFNLPKHQEDKAVKWKRLQEKEAMKHANVLEESYGSNPVPFSAVRAELREEHCHECRDMSSESRKRCEGQDCSRTEQYRPQVEYIQNLVNSRKGGQSHSNSSISQIAASIQNLGSARSREGMLRENSLNRMNLKSVGVVVTTDQSRKSVDRIRGDQMFNRVNPIIGELRTSYELKNNVQDDNYQRLLPRSVLNTSKPALLMNSNQAKQLDSISSIEGEHPVRVNSTSSFTIAGPQPDKENKSYR